MDVFYGGVSENLAYVYVRLPRDAADTRTVTGTVRGPNCALSHTLPATIALRDMGAGPTLLGAAEVPDPCCWSPQLPALYDVHVDVRDRGRVVATYDQSIGIRRLGVAGHNLRWEGKRWVLRAVSGGHFATADAASDAEPTESIDAELAPTSDVRLAAFRDASAALYLQDPTAATCRGASQAGVVIIAQLTDPRAIETQLGELARWGAVAFAVLPPGVTATSAELHNAAPNLLLAQHCEDTAAVQPVDWADLLVCRVNDVARFHQAVSACPLPIVAERRLNEREPVAAARAACDRLQSDLAPRGDYAGYLVTQP